MLFISLTVSDCLLIHCTYSYYLYPLSCCLILMLCKASLYIPFHVRCCSGTLLKNSVLADGKVEHSADVC